MEDISYSKGSAERPVVALEIMFRNVSGDFLQWKEYLPDGWRCVSAGEYKELPRPSPPVNIIEREYSVESGATSSLDLIDLFLRDVENLDKLTELSRNTECVWFQFVCCFEEDMPVLIFEPAFVNLLSRLRAKLEIVKRSRKSAV